MTSRYKQTMEAQISYTFAVKSDLQFLTINPCPAELE